MLIGSDDKCVRVLNLISGECVRSISFEGRVRYMLPTHHHVVLVLFSRSGKLADMDVHTGEVAKYAQPKCFLGITAIARLGNTGGNGNTGNNRVGFANKGEIYILNTGKKKIIGKYEVGGGVINKMAALDDNTLLIEDGDNFHILHLDNGTQLEIGVKTPYGTSAITPVHY